MPNEVPIFNLGNPTWIQAVAVPESPIELAGYAGRYLAVRDEADLPPIGTRGIVVVNGVSVPGFLRNINGSYEWVIMPAQDPLDVLVVGMAGPQGWVNQAAGTTWLQIAYALRTNYGVSGQDLAWGWPQLFNAALAEAAARRDAEE